MAQSSSCLIFRGIFSSFIYDSLDVLFLSSLLWWNAGLFSFPPQVVSSALRASLVFEREDDGSDAVAAIIFTLKHEKPLQAAWKEN